MRGNCNGPALSRFFFAFAIFFVLATFAALADRAKSEALYQKAEQALSRKDDMAAVLPLQQAVQADPDYDKPAVALADVYERFKKFGDAAKLMEKAVKIAPVPANWLRLGKFRYEEQISKSPPRKFDGALTALKKCVAKNPKNKDAQYYIGRICIEQGDYSKAEAALKIAVSLDDKNPDYKYWLGYTYFKLDKHDDAQTVLKEVTDKLASSKKPPYEDAKQILDQMAAEKRSQLIRKIVLMVVPLVGLLVVVGAAFMFLKNRRPSSIGGGAVSSSNESFELAADATSYEEIGAAALKRFCSMTQMAHGAMYVTNLDGDELSPKSTLSMDLKELQNMQLDVNELPRWIEHNDGKPFQFKVEKKEVLFLKAFPDTRDMMEPLNMKIGVPFVYQEKLLGIAFLGIKTAGDVTKLKKLFDRSQLDIFRLSIEIATALARLHEDEAAYVDVLTKLKSRKYVEEHLPRSLVNAEEVNRKGVVMVFEFDQFRTLEEQYGESHAETVLKTVADDVKGYFAEYDDSILARLEGGKFFGFLSAKGLDEAQDLAQQVYNRIGQVPVSQKLPTPTASVGVAIFPIHGRKADDLLWSAERVMMGIAAGGGNSVGYAEAVSAKGADDSMRPGKPAAPAPSPSGSGSTSGGGISRPTTPPPSPAAGGVGFPSIGPTRSPIADLASAAKPSQAAAPVVGTDSYKPGVHATGQTPSGFVPGRPTGALTAPAGFSGTLPGLGGSGAPPSGSGSLEQRPAASPPAWIPGFSGAPPPPGTAAGVPAPPRTVPAPPPSGVVPKPAVAPPPPPPPTAIPTLPKPPGGSVSPNGDQGAAVPGARVPSWMKNPMETPPAPPGAAPPPPPAAVPPGDAPRRLLAPAAPPPAPAAAVAPKPQAAASKSPFGRREVKEEAAPAPPEPPPAAVAAPPPPPAAPAPPPPPAATAPPPPPAPAKPMPPPMAAPASAPVPSINAASPGRDPLTGFLQSAAMQQAVDAEINRSRGANDPCSVLYFRMDKRAETAEQMNAVVTEVTTLIKDFLKEGTDVPGRMGVDVFAILLPRTSARIACNLAEQIRFTVGNQTFAGGSLQSTISVGIAGFPDHAENAGGLLGCAQKVSLKVQQGGGNAIKVYDPADT